MVGFADVARACGLPWMPVAAGSAPVRDAAAWHALDALTAPPALRRHLTVVLAECEERRDVACAFVAGRFAVPLARLAVVPLLAHGCVLSYAPSGLWLRLDARGLITAVRLADATVEDAVPGVAAPDAAPAGTVAGAAPAAATPSGRAALRAAAIACAVAAYQPLVAGLLALGGLGARALWGQLADAVVSAVGQHLPGAGPSGAQDEALRWLQAADPPLWVRPEFAVVEHRGDQRLAWRRGSCCLAYRLTAFGLCTGCPLRSRAAWLAAAAR